MMKYQKSIKTSIGKIVVLIEEEKVIALNVNQEIKKGIPEKQSSLIQKVEKQLKEYLEGKRKEFTIPYSLKGTTFQLKVWEELLKIPYGETCSYLDIAKRIGNEKAYRAVGMANHHNPIPILIPCHRVIGKNGKLIGYGLGINLKETLLGIEKRNSYCNIT